MALHKVIITLTPGSTVNFPEGTPPAPAGLTTASIVLGTEPTGPTGVATAAAPGTIEIDGVSASTTQYAGVIQQVDSTGAPLPATDINGAATGATIQIAPFTVSDTAVPIQVFSGYTLQVI